MKTFRQFLIEKSMSPTDAMKVLGLQPGFSADDLSDAHKNAVRQFHPDRPGGNAEKMVQANNARDALKGKGGAYTVDVASSRQRQQDMDEKRQAYAQVAREAAEKHLDLDAFVTHFADTFGEPFTVGKAGWWSNDPTQASYAAEFANAARTIVLDFRFYIDYSDLFGSKSLSNPEIGLNMTISSNILYNRKKVKLSQSNYRLDRAYNVLSDPNVMFPADKLKAQAEKSSARKLSKRDVILTLEKELGARIEYSGPQIWAYVPVGPYNVAFYRVTMMGSATWMVSGIYEKHRRSIIVSGGWIHEDEPSMTYLMNALRDLQRHAPDSPAGVAAGVESILQYFKSQRG